MSAIPTSTPDMEFDTNSKKIVLILCGLVASGKSTFAEALQQHYPSFRRCNQDDLGDRRRVEQLARDSLSQGHSVCIDRTNFNASQRSYWIQIALEFPDTEIWVIVFDTPYEICAERLKHRTSHPTITSANQGLTILSRFASDFRYPAAHEGFHRILYVKPSDHISPVYSRSDITAILLRVQNSALLINPTQSATYQYQGRQNSREMYHQSSPRAYEYSNRERRDGWNEYRPPSGRSGGGNRGTNSNRGPPRDIRGWLNTSYRGNVGLHAANTRRTWQYPTGPLGNQINNSTEYVRQGTGTEQDAFVID